MEANPQTLNSLTLLSGSQVFWVCSLPPLLKANVFLGNMAALQLLREKVRHWRWATDIEQSLCWNVVSYLLLCYSSFYQKTEETPIRLGTFVSWPITAGWQSSPAAPWAWPAPWLTVCWVSSGFLGLQQAEQKIHHQLLFREPTSLLAFVETKTVFSQVNGYFIKK